MVGGCLGLIMSRLEATIKCQKQVNPEDVWKL